MSTRPLSVSYSEDLLRQIAINRVFFCEKAFSGEDISASHCAEYTRNVTYLSRNLYHQIYSIFRTRSSHLWCMQRVYLPNIGSVKLN